MSSLLSVKQDFSQLTADLSENDCLDSSIVSTVSECEESSAADVEVSDAVNQQPVDVADDTAGDTEVAEHVEQQSQSEHVDERQRDISCDTTSRHSVSPVECDESYDSRLIHTKAGTQPDKFCDCSSADHEDAIPSDQLSEAKLKKVSRKRKAAECETSTDPRHDGKKLTRNMEMPPPQHIRTLSGIFVVHEVAQHGEILNSSR